MLTVTTDVIHKAVAILGNGGISDDVIESGIESFAENKLVARRLIDCIPEAFGIVLASHVGKINVPSMFSARLSNGNWKSFEFRVEPIFDLSLRIATDMYHTGDRSTFGNVAERSSIIGALNKALNAGASIEGATLSGPALMGVPAETYETKSNSLWEKLFRGSSQA